MAFGKHGTEQMGVLIVNEEDSARAIQDRYKALNVLDRKLPIYLHIAKGLKIDKSFVTKIIAEMKEKNLKLLILDSLRAVHTSNENDSAEMQVILDFLKEFARAGITVLFTHHNRKKSMTDKGDMAESTRGSSAVNAAVSGHVSLEERIGETGTFLIVRHLKSKAVEKIQPFELQIMKEDKQISFKYIGSFEEGEKKVLESMDTIMNILVNEKYVTVASLAKSGVASSAVVREALKQLSEKSLIGRINRAEAKRKGIIIPGDGKSNENLFFLIEHRQINKDVELEMYTQPFND
jgi:RecA-family ATPase